MASQKRYYYIRVVVDGEKYRSLGFCDKSDFTNHLARDLKHPFFYCDGYPRAKIGDNSIFEIQFWRADGHNGNHYFLGSLSGIHPANHALPLAVYLVPAQPVRFYREEARDPIALSLKLMQIDKMDKTVIIGKDKLNLPLGYHKVRGETL